MRQTDVLFTVFEGFRLSSLVPTANDNFAKFQEIMVTIQVLSDQLKRRVRTHLPHFGNGNSIIPHD